MSRRPGRLSRTAALLLLAVPAAAQDDAARFPAASSRAELQARRAWYLWSAQTDPQQAVTELQQALQAAADDPARTAALNFYVAVALERSGNPEAWQKQLRQLEALGVEPYAGWAAAQTEAPAALPAKQDPQPREIPSYLRRWAENLDDDADLKNTQEAREELRRLGVLAVPAILAKLPGYGVLGLRHATELLLPHADERVLRALEQRMLGGDESALYVIATEVETLPAEPRHRLGAIALHSPSLPAAIHGAACCADVPEQRARVLEVLGQALHASSTEVRNVALAVLAMPVLGGEEQVEAWMTEVLQHGSTQQREALIEFWLQHRDAHRQAAGTRFHAMLGAPERQAYWRIRLSGRAPLDPWELQLALIDGAPPSPTHPRGTASTGVSTGSFVRESVLEMTDRLSELLLREPPIPAVSVEWIFDQARQDPPLRISKAATLRYVDHSNPDIAFLASLALIQVAPRTAVEQLPLGSTQQNDNLMQLLYEVRKALPASVTAGDVPLLLDYLRRLDAAHTRYRDDPLLGQIKKTSEILAAVAAPEHLGAILPMCRLDGPSSDSVRQALGAQELPPLPTTPEQARLALAVLHELPSPMADRLTASIQDAVDESCAEALGSAIRDFEQVQGGIEPPNHRASLDYYELPLAADTAQRRLLGALRHCGQRGQEQLRSFLLDPDLGDMALIHLFEDPESDPVALARTVFTPPGNRALYGAFLGKPGTHGYDSSRFRALLDDTVRPHVRAVLAALTEHGEIEARPFLDALPRTERIDTCRAMIQAAVGRTDLVASQLDLVMDALRSLGALQDPTLADTFALAFQSPTLDVRLLAIDQLASMLSPLAGPALLRALDDPSETVRTAAHNALSTLQSHQENKQRWQEWIERNTPGKDRKDG